MTDAMGRRRVLSSERDPEEPGKRRLYKLDCGHTVSRRGHSEKAWALCGLCG